MEYRIEYQETHTNDYTVEADSREEAEDKFQQMIDAGEIDFSDLTMDDFDFTAKAENPPGYQISLTEEEILLLSDGLLSLIDRAGKSPVSDPAVSNALAAYRGRCQSINHKILHASKAAPTEDPASAGLKDFDILFSYPGDYFRMTVTAPDTYTDESLAEKLLEIKKDLSLEKEVQRQRGFWYSNEEDVDPCDILDVFVAENPTASWRDFEYDVEIRMED